MKKKVIIITSVVFLLLLSCYFLFLTSKSRSFQFFGKIVNRVNTSQKVIALTFDDAPSDKTGQILDILAEQGIKATFYVIGQEAEKYPDQLKAIISNGNEVGNHTYSHKRMVLKSPSFVANEIEKTENIIRNSGYIGTITFRPPNGKKLFILPWHLWRNNINTIMWDIEPDTYYQGYSHKIVEYTLDNIKPGSIILIHPFCGSDCNADREALPILIEQLKEKGYKFVTISELMKY